MKAVRYFAWLAVFALLAGCETQTQYESIAKELRENPAFKAEATERCRTKFETYPTSVKRELGAYLGVAVTAVPGEWCRRLFTLMASGRMGYRDYVDILNGAYNDEDKLFRMMRSFGSPAPIAAPAPSGERRAAGGCYPAKECSGDLGNQIRGAGAQR